MAITVRPAQPTDYEAVLRLLIEQQLPTDGLSEHWTSTLVASENGHVVGSAALEIYSDGALLRSVAVTSLMQGGGVGRQLTEAAIDLARSLRVPALYLLTTTADRYFPRFGFETISRTAVATCVQASVEFRSACPASATVMRKQLR